MRMPRFFGQLWFTFLLFAVSAGVHAQQSTPPKDSPAPAPLARLTIEVTGGDTNKPIENASV